MFSRKINDVDVNEASDFYFKLSKACKNAKDWGEVANNFEKFQEKQSNLEMAEKMMLDGACSLGSGDIEKAIECFKKAANIYLRIDRNLTAASTYEKIANIYFDNGDCNNFVECLLEASKIYTSIDSINSACKLEMRVANFYCARGDYKDAFILFDKIGRIFNDNKLVKYGATDVFFNALTCLLLCKDYENFKTQFEIYCNLDKNTMNANKYDAIWDCYIASLTDDKQVLNELINDDVLQKFDLIKRLC